MCMQWLFENIKQESENYTSTSNVAALINTY
jgi:hypothetical protein